MQKLKELMSRDVKVISPDLTIRDAAKQMRDGDFGMMPVGEDDRHLQQQRQCDRAPKPRVGEQVRERTRGL